MLGDRLPLPQAACCFCLATGAEARDKKLPSEGQSWPGGVLCQPRATPRLRAVELGDALARLVGGAGFLRELAGQTLVLLAGDRALLRPLASDWAGSRAWRLTTA